MAEGSCEGREGGGGRRADALSAVGPKRLIYAWRYVDRVHASSKEEYLLAPDHHTGDIALTRRQAANQHLASCEAEEEALCRRAGKRPRPRALMAFIRNII